jgi:hypothetical protein
MPKKQKSRMPSKQKIPPKETRLPGTNSVHKPQLVKLTTRGFDELVDYANSHPWLFTYAPTSPTVTFGEPMAIEYPKDQNHQPKSEPKLTPGQILILQEAERRAKTAELQEADKPIAEEIQPATDAKLPALPLPSPRFFIDPRALLDSENIPPSEELYQGPLGFEH